MYGITTYDYTGEGDLDWQMFIKEKGLHAPFSQVDSVFRVISETDENLSFHSWEDTTRLVIPPEML